jgi:hypothetical protein
MARRIDLLLVGPMAKLAYRAKGVSRKLLRNLTINHAKKSEHERDNCGVGYRALHGDVSARRGRDHS